STSRHRPPSPSAATSLPPWRCAPWIRSGPSMSSGSEAHHRSISRRQFIGALSVPLLVAACGRPYDRQLFSLPERSAVGLFAADSYSIDFAELLGRGLRELGVNVRGKRVFLK